VENCDEIKKKLCLYLTSNYGIMKYIDLIKQVDTEAFARKVHTHLIGMYKKPKDLIREAVRPQEWFQEDVLMFVLIELAHKRTYKEKGPFKKMFSQFVKGFRSLSNWIYDHCDSGHQLMLDLSCVGPLFSSRKSEIGGLQN